MIARTGIILLYLASSLMLFAPSAGAAGEDGTPPGGIITIPDMWLTFLVAAGLPVLVGFVKARFASSRVGALLLLALSVIAGWLTSLQATGGSFEPKAALTAIFISFVTAAGFHYGFLKPTGITGSEGVVQRAVSGGVGGKDSKAVEHTIKKPHRKVLEQ